MDSSNGGSLGPYHLSSRSELSKFIPEGIKRALDVGCAAGRFGAEIKAKGAEVWGIEPNPVAASEAKALLDRVFTGTFREFDGELPVGGFDLISFTDVLEHMPDCEQVLVDVQKLLAPGGRVLVSLPNIRHWPALLTIFWRGDFPYQEQGIFDRTHMRFFTHESMLRMFEECGYEVEVCEGINGHVSGKLPLANFLTGGRFWDSAFLQFAILAKPKS